MRSTRGAEGLLVVAVALWGLNYTVQRYGLTNGFRPLVFAALRLVIAAIGCALLVPLTGGGWRMSRRDLWVAIVVGALGQGGMQVTNSYAYRFTGASTIAIVFGLLPVALAVVARLMGIERLSARHWAGVAVSVLGVAMIAVGRGGGIGGDLAGVLLSLASVCGFAVYTVILYRLARRNGTTLLNAVSIASAAVFMLVVGSGQILQQDWSAPNGLSWACVLYSSIVSLSIANGLFFYAQKRVGPARSGLYANLQPVFGVVFAVLILGESLRTIEIVGAGVVAAGIYLARRPTALPPASGDGAAAS